MTGYGIAMIVVSAFGGLALATPFENRPRWLNWITVAWVIVWAGPPLVTLWIKGTFA
jgi:hypothetical protein